MWLVGGLLYLFRMFCWGGSHEIGALVYPPEFCGKFTQSRILFDSSDDGWVLA